MTTIGDPAISHLCSLLFSSRYRSSKLRRLPLNRTTATRGRKFKARLLTDFGDPRGAEDVHVNPVTYHNNTNLSMALCIT